MLTLIGGNSMGKVAAVTRRLIASWALVSLKMMLLVARRLSVPMTSCALLLPSWLKLTRLSSVWCTGVAERTRLLLGVSGRTVYSFGRAGLNSCG